jgi:hypothetical protein
MSNSREVLPLIEPHTAAKGIHSGAAGAGKKKKGFPFIARP